MQTKSPAIVLSSIAKSGLIVTFSQEDPELALRQLRVLYENGVSVVEYMARAPQSESVFSYLFNWKSQFAKECFLGIGTIKSVAQLEIYVELQADFLVSPMCIPDVVQRESVLYIPGVATPGEISFAMNRGFSVCKIFPANCLGGPEYIKSIKGPFPQINFIPSGGIGLDENLIMQYQKAGAFCVCLGGAFWVPLISSSWEKQMQKKTKMAVSLTKRYFEK